jgi:tetratricopeptide (TPR) repeat protein
MAVALFVRAAELGDDEDSGGGGQAEVADCLYALGKAGRAGALPDAVDAYSRLIVEHPDEELTPRACLRLSECLLAQGKAEQAARVLATASRFLSRHAKTADGWLHLGRAKLKLGEYEGAAEALAQITSDYPRSQEAKEAALLTCHARAAAAGLLPDAPSFAEASDGALRSFGEGRALPSTPRRPDLQRTRPAGQDSQGKIGRETVGARELALTAQDQAPTPLGGGVVHESP